MKQNNVITIFGANGFLGAEITRQLAHAGFTLKLAHKHPRACDFLKTSGQVGQVVPVQCDFSMKSITDVVAGSIAVVNCIGILAEGGKRTFMSTHRDLPENIAKACAKQDVGQFVHISALGIDKSKSKYAASKLAGEKAILKAFDKATILRPSIVFGPKDSFFNMFAGMARVLPFLPLIGGGKTMFQPVYVGDVAQSVVNAIKDKHINTYELGGPDVASFKGLLEKMKQYTGQSVALLPLPFTVASFQAFFMQYLPGAPLTPDQVTSLKSDNIVSDNAMTLSDLGVKQTSMDVILPTYLDRFK
jgi:uncharacterized protein YbjT (DUF2867 family)